jgi:hypothetical protein
MASISDMVRHMAKSMQSLASDADPGDSMVKWNSRNGKAVDECLVQLSRKVNFSKYILEVYCFIFSIYSSTAAVYG